MYVWLPQTKKCPAWAASAVIETCGLVSLESEVEPSPQSNATSNSCAVALGLASVKEPIGWLVESGVPDEPTMTLETPPICAERAASSTLMSAELVASGGGAVPEKS